MSAYHDLRAGRTLYRDTPHGVISLFKRRGNYVVAASYQGSVRILYDDSFLAVAKRYFATADARPLASLILGGVDDKTPAPLSLDETQT